MTTLANNPAAGPPTRFAELHVCEVYLVDDALNPPSPLIIRVSYYTTTTAVSTSLLFGQRSRPTNVALPQQQQTAAANSRIRTTKGTQHKVHDDDDDDGSVC